jgi:hypothetical protein
MHEVHPRLHGIYVHKQPILRKMLDKFTEMACA